VINLDMSRSALAAGRTNHRLNQLDERRASFLCLELFRSFSRLKKLAPFDLIICDPPYAQGRHFQAARDWPKLIRRFPALLSEGGQVLACVSNPHFNRDALQRAFFQHAPQARLSEELSDAENFPDCAVGKGTVLLLYRF
jgi:23S rRNA (cytosine1962-C5)-methyltransferase